MKRASLDFHMSSRNPILIFVNLSIRAFVQTDTICELFFIIVKFSLTILLPLFALGNHENGMLAPI